MEMGLVLVVGFIYKFNDVVDWCVFYGFVNVVIF